MDLTVAPEMYRKLMTALRQDSDFLASVQVIDYSLLVGVHNKESGDVFDDAEAMPLYLPTRQDQSKSTRPTVKEEIIPDSIVRSNKFTPFFASKS